MSVVESRVKKPKEWKERWDYRERGGGGGGDDTYVYEKREDQTEYPITGKTFRFDFYRSNSSAVIGKNEQTRL